MVARGTTAEENNIKVEDNMAVLRKNTVGPTREEEEREGSKKIAGEEAVLKRKPFTASEKKAPRDATIQKAHDPRLRNRSQCKDPQVGKRPREDPIFSMCCLELGACH